MILFFHEKRALALIIALTIDKFFDFCFLSVFIYYRYFLFIEVICFSFQKTGTSMQEEVDTSTYDAGTGTVEAIIHMNCFLTILHFYEFIINFSVWIS